jgi:hypothetical protein
MTPFEQYQEVSQFIIDTFTQTPVFIEGEVIDVLPPYMIVKAYGTGNQYYNKSRGDTKGYSLVLYDIHRGKVEKLLSDALGTFMQVRTSSGLMIDNATASEYINRLEDTLYEGVITFTVESTYIKP